MSPGDAELQGLSGFPRWNLVRFPVAFACWRLSGFVGITVQAVQQYHIPQQSHLDCELIFQALFPPSAGQWLKACQGYFLGPQRLFVPLVGRFDFHQASWAKSQRPIYIETEKWSQTHVFPNSKSRNICSVSSSPHPIIIAPGLPSPGLHVHGEVFLDTKLGPCKAKLCFCFISRVIGPPHPSLSFNFYLSVHSQNHSLMHWTKIYYDSVLCRTLP